MKFTSFIPCASVGNDGGFLSSLPCAPRVVIVKAMAAAMMEVSFVLLGLERRNIGGERVGDSTG